MFVISMKKNKKIEQAKFYCESCGAEVKQNAKVCTNCGKFFSSVRCPKCGRTGKTEEFTNGCPDCGYAVNNYHGNPLYSVNKNKEKNKLFSFLSNSKYKQTNSKNLNRKIESSLPLWIYIVCIIILAILIICLYSCFLNELK